MNQLKKYDVVLTSHWYENEREHLCITEKEDDLSSLEITEKRAKEEQPEPLLQGHP